MQRLIHWLRGKGGIISYKKDRASGGNEQAQTTDLKSSKCYTSINELPFRIFKSCAVDNDLIQLVKEGDAPHETLIQIWQEISEQFSEAMGGDKFVYTIGNMWTAESLNSKINRLEHILEIFKKSPYEELTKVFEAEGWIYPTDDLNNYVECIQNEIGNLKVQLENALSKVDQKEGEKPSYERYDEALVAISGNEGREIDDSITTMKFCIYYKRLIKAVEKHAATRRAA